MDKFIGFGDYKISQNSIVSPGSVPAMHSNKMTAVIRHREYIRDIISSNTAFVSYQYPINAGMTATFPWLAQVASAYECYRFKGLIFEFKTLSGDVTTASNQGYVAGCINYNAAAAPYASKSQIENALGGRSCKPSESMYFPMECKPLFNPLNEYFVRDQGVLSNQNIQFYDVGTFTIAVGGNATNGVVLGELWVTYEVEFCKPALLDTPTVEGGAQAHLALSSITNTNPLGAQNITTYTYDNIGLIVTGTAITFPQHGAAKYMLVYSARQTGSNITLTYPSVSLNNCTYNTNHFANAGSQSAGATNGTILLSNAWLTWVIMLNVTDPSQTASITFGSSGVIPNGSGDLWVYELPSLAAGLPAPPSTPSVTMERIEEEEYVYPPCPPSDCKRPVYMGKGRYM